MKKRKLLIKTCNKNDKLHDDSWLLRMLQQHFKATINALTIFKTYLIMTILAPVITYVTLTQRNEHYWLMNFGL